MATAVVGALSLVVHVGYRIVAFTACRGVHAARDHGHACFEPPIAIGHGIEPRVGGIDATTDDARAIIHHGEVNVIVRRRVGTSVGRWQRGRWGQRR